MDVSKLEIQFPSNLKFVKTTVKDLLYFIKHNVSFCTEDDLFDLKLIYNELLINAIIHGNNNDESKWTKIYVVTDNNDLVYSYVLDEGEGFLYKKVLEKIENSPNLFLESGRGLKLIHSLSHRLRFNKKGNKTIFFKRVNQNG